MKLKNLSKKAKIAITSGTAGVLALAVALGLWQPWNAGEKQQEDTTDRTQQEVVKPPEVTQPPLTITVGGEEIVCTVYEGEGWSIYLPEGWTVEEKGDVDALLLPPGGKEKETGILISREKQAVYLDDFVSIYPVEMGGDRWLERMFYRGDPTGAWSITCRAAEKEWSEYQKLMTALVRTMTVGTERPFSGVSPVASQPDWQMQEGVTLLWMDKDGYAVSDVAEEFVVTDMMSWDQDTKADYTGKYYMEDMVWAGNYTCLDGHEYVDVFTANVWYQLAEGRESGLSLSGNMQVKDGWLHNGFPLHTVVFHDGSAVKETRTMFTNYTSPGQALYAAELMYTGEEGAVALTAEQLKECEAWFNELENNGLLRFPYDAADVGVYLDLLFYDLGEKEETLTAAEKTALEAAGVMLETDVTRLPRAYMMEYLQEKLLLTAAQAEEMLRDEEAVGLPYLEEYDAWYTCHGDTAYMPYTFDRGQIYPADGSCIKIWYKAPFLTVADAGNLMDEPMVLTLRPGADGVWRVESNTMAIYAA